VLLIAVLLAAGSIAGPPGAPQTPHELESLIDLARAVPPEFSSDILLRIAGSPLVAGPNRKRELLDEAFILTDFGGGAAAVARWGASIR
jgi:hypothetical protein